MMTNAFAEVSNMRKLLSALQSTSAAGGCIFGLSLIELNALLGIVLTIASLILLIVPKIIDLVRKIKKSNEDGVVTDEEIKDIKDSTIDILNDVKESVEEIKKEIEETKHDNN